MSVEQPANERKQQPVEIEYGVAFKVNPNLDLLTQEDPMYIYVEPVPLLHQGEPIGRLRLLKDKKFIDNPLKTPLGPINSRVIIHDHEVKADTSDQGKDLPLDISIYVTGLSEEEARKYSVDYLIGEQEIKVPDRYYYEEDKEALFDPYSHFPQSPTTFDRLSFRINKY